MPDVNDIYTTLPPSANPDGAGAFPEVYAAQPKAFFLSNMVTTLKASGLRLYPLNRRGNVTHRFLDTIALEMARLSKAIGDIVERAILRSAYLAFGFTAQQATYATGIVQFVRTSPAPASETIPAGTIIVSPSGATVVTLAAATIAPGTTTGTVNARAETVGSGGNTGVGAYNIALSRLPGAYTVSNVTPLSGGTDGENAAMLFRRFQVFIASRRFGSKAYIEGQVRSVTALVSAATVAVRDAAVILPWRVPGLGIPPGVFYVVIESGGGTAPPALVAAAQTTVDDATVAGQQGLVVASSAYAVSAAFSYKLKPNVLQATAQTNMIAAWNQAFNGALIEDGAGRGAIDLSSVRQSLLEAEPGIYELTLTAPTITGITPTLGSTVTPGTLTLTLLP